MTKRERKVYQKFVNHKGRCNGNIIVDRTQAYCLECPFCMPFNATTSCKAIDYPSGQEWAYKTSLRRLKADKLRSLIKKRK